MTVNRFCLIKTKCIVIKNDNVRAASSIVSIAVIVVKHDTFERTSVPWGCRFNLPSSSQLRVFYHKKSRHRGDHPVLSKDFILFGKKMLIG